MTKTDFCTDPAGDLAEIMRQPAGRRLMWWVLAQTHLFNQQFTGNSHTFFALGERNLGLKLVQLMGEVDPTMFPRLLLENATEVAHQELTERKQTESNDDERQE